MISTYNRASLLAGTLASLTRQTLPQGLFEVVIVDDGSTDETAEVCRAFAPTLPHRYVRQRNAGLASARNHGLYLSSAPVVLFMDDDDFADPELLEQHVMTHQRYPDDRYAVLGYTRLQSPVARDPLMHFVTEVGCFMFAYPYVQHGDLLDFEFFWGGRTSCKRAFLLDHGVYNPVFRFGCEDIELAYRLSPHGLQVVYNSNAITTMVRQITFDGFCNRLIKQGRSNFVFSRLHPDPTIARWTEAPTVEATWAESEKIFDTLVRTGRQLDQMARLRQSLGLPLDPSELAVLHRTYWLTFRAAKAKGFREAWASLLASQAADSPRQAPAVG